MQRTNEIDLRRYFRALRANKWICVALFAVITALGVTYAVTRPPVYTTSATVLIEDSSSDVSQRSGSSLSMMMRSFSMGGFSNVSVDNEMLLIGSHDLLDRVVRKLSLNLHCYEPHGLSSRQIWSNIPVKLSLPQYITDSLPHDKDFAVSISMDHGTVTATASRGRFFATKLGSATGQLPLALQTPMGVITIMAADSVAAISSSKFVFTVSSYETETHALLKSLDMEVAEKVTDGITISLNGTCPARDRAILNTLLDEYNGKRMGHNRETARKEVDFLNERIDNLFTQLLDSEKKIEEFKTDARFVSIEDEAPILLENSLGAHENLMVANSEVLYCEQVLESLKSNPEAMLPAYSMPGSQAEANPMVQLYNQQVATLNELRRSAKPGNKALQLAEERTVQMRESVIESISQTLTAARRAIKARSGAVGQMDAHLRKLPKVEREYVNLSRDNLIKNELYAFLMEKRESALLKFYSQSSLGLIIDPAYTSPKRLLARPVAIAGIAILFGALIAMFIPVIIMKRNRRITDAFDLADAGLENRTFIMGSDRRDCANMVRAYITGQFNRGVVYMANLANATNDAATRAILDSFHRAETTTALIDSEKINDSLLSERIANSITESCARYTFVAVPEPERVTDLSTVIAETDDSLLMIITSSDGLTREYAEKLADTFTPQRLAIVVTK